VNRDKTGEADEMNVEVDLLYNGPLLCFFSVSIKGIDLKRATENIRGSLLAYHELYNSKHGRRRVLY